MNCFLNFRLRIQNEGIVWQLNVWSNIIRQINFFLKQSNWKCGYGYRWHSISLDHIVSCHSIKIYLKTIEYTWFLCDKKLFIEQILQCVAFDEDHISHIIVKHFCLFFKSFWIHMPPGICFETVILNYVLSITITFRILHNPKLNIS